MSDLDLLYSEVESELRASVRSLLADRSPWRRVLARSETADTYDLELWRALTVDLGVAALIVPEKYDGAGASYREAAVVLEEIGRAVAPVPYLGSAIVATTALLACADTELLGALARGERTGTLVVPFSTVPFSTAPSAVGHHTVVADGGRLRGTVTSVADALPADLLLVPTRDGLFAADAGADGVNRTAVTSLDLTRQLCDITFDGVTARLVAEGPAADSAVRDALTAGAAMLASEQLGVATWCLDTTVDYLKTRYQFGRPIGSYQALKHRIADVWVDVSQARAAARYAAACLATGDPDLPVAATVAKAFNSAVAVRAAEECLQLHGGIGFTWEHPTHLYLKRAKSTSIAFGTPSALRTALGDLVGLAPPNW